MTFTIYTGPMFGGKTSRMLAALERARYQKKKIVLFKPLLDTRYADAEVKTHCGAAWDAINVSTGEEMIEASKGAEIIAVDEAFMIPGCAKVLINLFSQGYDIYVSTIQLSSEGKAFEEPMIMFPYATKIEVCPAVCPITGKDAYYTMATTDKSSEIQVGGTEAYEPRCYEEYVNVLRNVI